MYGPPGKNDHIGYFHGNPVEIREGVSLPITIETTMRVDRLEEIWFAEQQGAGWLKGIVRNSEGAPVQGPDGPSADVVDRQLRAPGTLSVVAQHGTGADRVRPDPEVR